MSRHFWMMDRIYQLNHKYPIKKNYIFRSSLTAQILANIIKFQQQQQKWEHQFGQLLMANFLEWVKQQCSYGTVVFRIFIRTKEETANTHNEIKTTTTNKYGHHLLRVHVVRVRLLYSNNAILFDLISLWSKKLYSVCFRWMEIKLSRYKYKRHACTQCTHAARNVLCLPQFR